MCENTEEFSQDEINNNFREKEFEFNKNISQVDSNFREKEFNYHLANSKIETRFKCFEYAREYSGQDASLEDIIVQAKVLINFIEQS